MQHSNQLVSHIFKNYGYFGVQENKLITDDRNLRCLVKYFNRDRAKAINAGERLNCNEKDWNIHDWYKDNRCIQQMNNIHLETALKRKGISSNKFPVYFGAGNMASLLYQFVLYYPDFKEQNIFYKKNFSKFDFDPQTGLRFISKVSCHQFGQKLGHIAEHLLATDANIQDRTIEIGKKLIYSINSLEFPDSNAILYYSKEIDCFWDKKAPLDMKNACEVKAANTFFGVKQQQLLIKTFALGSIRILIRAINHDSIISKVEVDEDIESLDNDGIVAFFYACLNNFTKIVIKNCLENRLTSGIIITYQTAFGRFLVISHKEEDYFWCYQFIPQTASFVGGQKFPRKLTAIRWPMSDYHPRFNLQRIRNIQNYEFEAALNSNRSLHYVDGNCLLVVKKNSELTYNLAKKFKFKVSLEDPIFTLVEQLLLIDYYEKYEE